MAPLCVQAKQVQVFISRCSFLQYAAMHDECMVFGCFLLALFVCCIYVLKMGWHRMTDWIRRVRYCKLTRSSFIANKRH